MLSLAAPETLKPYLSATTSCAQSVDHTGYLPKPVSLEEYHRFINIGIARGGTAHLKESKPLNNSHTKHLLIKPCREYWNEAGDPYHLHILDLK